MTASTQPAPPTQVINALRLVLPACRRALATVNTARHFDPQAAADQLKSFVNRQFQLANLLAANTGAKHADWQHLFVAGNLLLDEREGGEADAAPLEAIVQTVLPHFLENVSNEVEPYAPSTTRNLLISLHRLNALFSAIPMGAPAEETTEFMAAAVVSLAQRCLSQSDEPDPAVREQLLADLIPTVTDVVIDAWGELAALILNPGDTGGSLADIEAALEQDFGRTLEAMPLGHEGSEAAVIKMAAAHIHERSAILCSGFAAHVSERHMAAIIAAYAHTFLVPLFRIAWLGVAEKQSRALEELDIEDAKQWIEQNAERPVSMRAVYDELSTLCRARKHPIETVKLDRFEVEDVCKKKLDIIWASYEGVLSLLNS